MVTASLSGLDVRSQSPSPDSILAQLPDRIAALIEISDGCWQYRGKVNDLGYANMTLNRRWTGLHRIVYEIANGRPALGSVDHTCHNADPTCPGGPCAHRSCLNPAHLEDVPTGVNVLRGKGLAAANLAKTHCPSGHPYAGANLYVWPDGKRRCRRCHNQREVAARAAGRRG